MPCGKKRQLDLPCQGSVTPQFKSPQMPFRATVLTSETDECRMPGRGQGREQRCLTLFFTPLRRAENTSIFNVSSE